MKMEKKVERRNRTRDARDDGEGESWEERKEEKECGGQKERKKEK